VAHEVNLDVFHGPIDLLLHLITRRRVDIYDVSLATITDEYVAALAERRGDLESATGFLVVAATLLELKSARLLPARGSELEDGSLLEERDLLLARLVECATYRTAGEWMSSALERGGLYFGRSAGLEPAFADLAPDPLARLALTDLGAAAAAVLAVPAAPELDTSHLAPIRASVRDAIGAVADTLSERGRATFEDLCGPRPARIQVVVRFLALLELLKAGAVELEQSGRWGTIEATWTGAVEAHDVLEDAAEYAGDAEGEHSG
jgi:segregation and condensation protein A